MASKTFSFSNPNSKVNLVIFKLIIFDSMNPGDKVVCVNDDNLYHIPVKKICKGLIYTLTEVFKCRCGNVYVRLAEVNIMYNMWCPKCDTNKDCIMFFHIERFRLLEKSEAFQEVHTSKKATVPVNIV